MLLCGGIQVVSAQCLFLKQEGRSRVGKGNLVVLTLSEHEAVTLRNAFHLVYGCFCKTILGQST